MSYSPSSSTWSHHIHRVFWPLQSWQVCMETSSEWDIKGHHVAFQGWAMRSPCPRTSLRLYVSREKVSQAQSGHIGFICFRLCLCVWTNVCMHACVFPQKPEEGSRSLGVGVTGVCGPPDLDAGMQILVLMTEQQVLTTKTCLQSQKWPYIHIILWDEV